VPFTFDPMSIYATNENLEFFKEYVKNYQLTIFNIANVPEGKYEFIIDKTAAPFGYKVYYDNNTLTV
jgi:hypothetical protein